jgi:hypothetical protein
MLAPPFVCIRSLFACFGRAYSILTGVWCQYTPGAFQFPTDFTSSRRLRKRLHLTPSLVRSSASTASSSRSLVPLPSLGKRWLAQAYGPTFETLQRRTSLRLKRRRREVNGLSSPLGPSSGRTLVSLKCILSGRKGPFDFLMMHLSRCSVQHESPGSQLIERIPRTEQRYIVYCF